MKAINRLYQYFDYKKIKPTRLEKESGLSNGYLGIQLKREADLGSGVIEKIVNNCRDLDIEWLITGRGKMLHEFYDPPELSQAYAKEPEYVRCERCIQKDELNKSLKDQVKVLKKLVKNLEDEKCSEETEQKRKAVS